MMKLYEANCNKQTLSIVKKNKKLVSVGKFLESLLVPFGAFHFFDLRAVLEQTSRVMSQRFHVQNNRSAERDKNRESRAGFKL